MEYSYKNLVEKLKNASVICKSLEEVELNTKKKIKAFLGVNLKNEYCFVVYVAKKSRFLLKDAKMLEELVPKEINFRYKKKIAVLNSPVCSKAKEYLKEWRIL